MACTSTLPKLRPSNWICTGEDLMVVMWTGATGKRLPIVVPRARLADVMSMSGAEAFDTPVPYTGTGDHLHLTLPDPDESSVRRLLESVWPR